MPALVLPRRVSHTRPPMGSLVNRAHPLARGLMAAWPLNEMGGLKVRDHVGQAHLGVVVADPALAWVPGKNGGCALSVNSGVLNERITMDLTAGTQTLTDQVGTGWSVAFLVKCRTQGLSTTFMQMRSPPGGGNTTILNVQTNSADASKVRIAAGLNNAAGGSANSASNINDVGSWHWWIATQVGNGGTPGSVYRDGIQVVSLGTNANPPWTSMNYISFMGTGADGFDGLFGGAFLWGRVLSPAEVLDFQEEPYEMFYVPEHRVWLRGAMDLGTQSLSSSIPHVATTSRQRTTSNSASTSVPMAATVTRLRTTSQALTSSIAMVATVMRTGNYLRTLTSSVAHTATVTRTGNYIRALVSAITHTAAVVATRIAPQRVSITLQLSDPNAANAWRAPAPVVGYPKGARIAVQATVVNRAGTPARPTDITVEILDPSGRLTVYGIADLVEETPGVVTREVDLLLDGRWGIRVQSGGPRGAAEAELVVLPSLFS